MSELTIATEEQRAKFDGSTRCHGSVFDVVDRNETKKPALTIRHVFQHTRTGFRNHHIRDGDIHNQRTPPCDCRSFVVTEIPSGDREATVTHAIVQASFFPFALVNAFISPSFFWSTETCWKSEQEYLVRKNWLYIALPALDNTALWMKSN